MNRIANLLLGLTLLLPLGTALALEPSTHSPAVTDPAPDAAHPTSNKQLLVPSGGVGMNALFLLASGETPKPTLILLHGLPGNERNLDLAQAARRAGWNVLVFTYRGAWGSPGKFSIAHSIEDAKAAVDFLHRPDVAQKYRVDPRRIVLGGHSMGAFAAAEVAASRDDLMGLLLIDAWNVGVDGPPARGNAAKRAELVAGFDDLGNSLVGATAKTLASEVERSPESWDLRTLAPRLAKRPIFLMWADRGIAEQNQALAKSLEQAGASKLMSAHLPTDHAFSDHRIALSVAVVDWLDLLANGAGEAP
jgi:pimeloyl-ACP methyl ester carboxylesterase